MQSTARGLLAGAFWGLVVGGGVLALATLALDSRRTARLDAERLAARPEAPAALARGHDALQSLPRPELSADPAPRGVMPKSDLVVASPRGFDTLPRAQVAALDDSSLPRLPTAPEVDDVASAITDDALLVRPSAGALTRSPPSVVLVRRAPAPPTKSLLLGNEGAISVLQAAGMQSPAADAPQDIAMNVSLSKPDARVIQLDSRAPKLAGRAGVPAPLAEMARASDIPDVDPAPSSSAFAVPFVVLPDAETLTDVVGVARAPETTRQPVRFGRLSWAPQLARSALNAPTAPVLAGTSDLRGPEPVLLALAPGRPESGLRVTTSLTGDADSAIQKRLPSAFAASWTVPQVSQTLPPPVPARLIVGGGSQAANLPRVVLVVAGDDAALQNLPDWAGSVGVRPGAGDFSSAADLRAAAIWLRAGETSTMDTGAERSHSAVLVGPNATGEQMTAVMQSGRTFAPIYRYIETAGAGAQAALEAAAVRASRDGQVVIMVANDRELFGVVDQWLADRAEAVRPVPLEAILR